MKTNIDTFSVPFAKEGTFYKTLLEDPKMKYSLAYLAAVLSCGVAAAQEAQPAKECCEAFKLDFATTASLYSFDSNDVVVVTEKFSFDFNEDLTFGVAVPFYNNGNDTGVSDVDFSVSYDLYNNKDAFLGASLNLDALVGVKVPLDGEYSSGGEIFYLGTVADLAWDKFVLSQSFNYEFVNDYTYTPIFNGFVGDDVYGGVTTLSYRVNDDMLFCINGTQQYAGDFNALLVGPSVEWSWKNLDGYVGVDFPVDYSVKGENLDVVVSAGIAFKF
jgi:hypothetical protein